MRRRSAAFAAFLLGVAASCSEPPSAPSDRSAHDVSTAISQTIAIAFGTYFPGAESVALPAACPYSAAAGRFVCAPATIGPLTYSLAYSLLDADGRSLGAPRDHAVTMRAVIDLQGRRTVVVEGVTVTTDVVDHHELLVSGLRSGTRAFTGTMTSRHETSRNAASVPHTVQDVVGATMNVRSDEGARWPRSGTITTSGVTTVLASGAMVPSTSRSHSVLEFDGTSVVTITTSIDEFTTRCRFDLSGRVATTCS